MYGGVARSIATGNTAAMTSQKWGSVIGSLTS